MAEKLIYLAGDTLFRPDGMDIYAKLKEICSKYGLKGMAPLDEKNDLDDLPPSKEKLMKIALFDKDLMDKCDAGIFCVDGFRATEMDPGTAVEIGYMYAKNKPINGYTADVRTYPERVHDHFDGKLTPRKPHEFGGEAGALQDPNGLMVDKEGDYYQNAMVDGFIEESGGKVFADEDMFKAFEKAAELTAKQLGTI